MNKKMPLRNKVVYQVYVRNHTREGTFRALEKDLDRIKALGADFIHLLPIHPCGAQNRKGALGSPYAVADYRAVNPEFGTRDDFAALVEAMHRRGILCIMDIVYNHTSPDSRLAVRHPEWFYQKPLVGGEGGIAEYRLGNRIGEWWDVVDLDYANPASGLWDYQIETLVEWAKLVDGFRCDVAPLVPLDFWLRARSEVAKVNPGAVWIAESVEPGFVRELRARGFGCSSDVELYRAFDVCYDYDIFSSFQNYLDGEVSLSTYAGEINRQEFIYPENYVKLRNLENHDRNRIAALVRCGDALRNWTAFNYFQKGLALVYAGQEASCEIRPSLFDKDEVDWGGLNTPEKNLSKLMKKLYDIRQEPIFADSSYRVEALPGDVLLASHAEKGEAGKGRKTLYGIFSLKGKGGSAKVPVPDGTYTNLIDGRTFRTGDGRIALAGAPVIFYGSA